MAESVSIADLIANLVIAEDKISVLSSLKTLTRSVHPSNLKDVACTINFNPIFDCLNTSDDEQISICCNVLESLLICLPPAVIVTQNQTELELGLNHPSPKVKGLSLEELKRCTIDINGYKEFVANMGLVMAVVRLLMDKDLGVAKVSGEILSSLTCHSDGLTVIFSSKIQDAFHQIMTVSTVVKFRVYEVIINIAIKSSKCLEYCVNSGTLRLLTNEIYKSDILVQLNCIELLTDLAFTEHGLQFLQEEGIVGKLESMLNEMKYDPLVGFLLPGLIKFFGNIGHVYPKEICSRYQYFISLLFSLLDNDDMVLKGVAIDTLGVLGSSAEGKLALDKQGEQMNRGLVILGETIRNSSTELRIRSLLCLKHLISLNPEDQNSELLSITETWFSQIDSKPMELLFSISKQPFSDLRNATLEVYVSLCLLVWGQQRMNHLPGFPEYLLDRSTESEKVSKELKFTIIQNLANSPTTIDVFGRPYMVQLRDYVREGPFYVKVQSEVAYEGAS